MKLKAFNVLLAIAAAFLLALPAVAQNDDNNGNGNDGQQVGEKTPDTQDYQILNRAETVPGNLDGSLTFDRRFSVTFDGSCAAASLDSSNNGTSYQVFRIVSPAGENLDAEAVLGSLADSVMFLYCDPFDPANPTNNLVAWDDDGCVGFGSAITPGDGVALLAGVTYELVISGFGPADSGTFDLVLGGDIIQERNFLVVPTMQEWTLIAFIALLAAGGVFMAVRNRKLQAQA